MSSPQWQFLFIFFLSFQTVKLFFKCYIFLIDIKVHWEVEWIELGELIQSMFCKTLRIMNYLFFSPLELFGFSSFFSSTLKISVTKSRSSLESLSIVLYLQLPPNNAMDIFLTEDNHLLCNTTQAPGRSKEPCWFVFEFLLRRLRDQLKSSRRQQVLSKAASYPLICF